MFRSIVVSESALWDETVKSFSFYDVYYLSGYVKGFALNGDGEPILFHYEDKEIRGICVMMKRDISLSGTIDGIDYYDLITPYGYGGWLFEGKVDKDVFNRFYEEYTYELIRNNIVSIFTRFHPLLKNADIIAPYLPGIVYLGDTINMYLESAEVIFANNTSKNRNTIRKAEKAGVVIKHSDDSSLIPIFMEIYNATMDRDSAAPYYYFKPEFYDSLFSGLQGNVTFFYAEYEGRIISISIIMYANGHMHYHLSGSLMEYRHLAPSNLLLNEAALWGSSMGFRTFHLGGGVGAGEDNLYKFKKAFNRNSNNKFAIGKEIINKDIYDRLVEQRVRKDKDFNPDSSFFPLYRA